MSEPTATLTLTEILRTRTLQAVFLNFSKENFFQENVLFWLEVDRYETNWKDGNDKENLGRAVEIVTKFIGNQSKIRISVDERVMEETAERVRRGAVQRGTFSVLKDMVFNTMDVYTATFKSNEEVRRVLGLRSSGVGLQVHTLPSSGRSQKRFNLKNILQGSSDHGGPRVVHMPPDEKERDRLRRRLRKHSIGLWDILVRCCTPNPQTPIALAVTSAARTQPEALDGLALSDLLKTMGKVGVELNVKDAKNNTPLHDVLSITNPDTVDHNEIVNCVKAILKSGADVNATNKENYAPVHTAISHSLPKAALVLINSGADVTLTTHNGNTPLHYAVHIKSEDHFEYLSLLNVLLECGAEIDPYNNRQETPLYRAVFNQKELGTLFLLQCGANPNLMSARSITPLQCACLCGHTQIANSLIKYGADVHAQGRDGTCMEIAEKANNRDIISMLINVGVSSKNRQEEGLQNFEQKHMELEKKILQFERWYLTTFKRPSFSSKKKAETNTTTSPTQIPPEFDNSAPSFEKIRLLGIGTTGEVWSAKHKDTGFVIALKLVNTQNQKARLSVVNEVKILHRCVHPNIVQYYGCFEDNETLHIMMEYCAVGTLMDMMKGLNRLFTELEAAVVTDCILKGLAYLHSQNIVHRDLKTNNVLVSNRGLPKIADFGVSALLQHKNLLNTVTGTPLFIAPEVVNGSGYSSPADIWSLGMIVLHIVNGTLPYIECSVGFVLLDIADLCRPPPSLDNQHLHSKSLKHFISCMLQKPPNERWSAEQLKEHPFLRDIPVCEDDLCADLIYEYVYQEKPRAPTATIDMHQPMDQMPEINSTVRQPAGDSIHKSMSPSMAAQRKASFPSKGAPSKQQGSSAEAASPSALDSEKQRLRNGLKETVELLNGCRGLNAKYPDHFQAMYDSINRLQAKMHMDDN